MSSARISLFAALAAAALQATAAQAQTSAVPVPGRVEFAIGPLWVGPQSLGVRDATLTTGTGGTLTVFSTSTELSGSAGIEGRIGVRVTRRLEVEASGSYGTPQLRTVISGDTEGAVSVTATDTMQQFTVGGGALWYPQRRRPASRIMPFITGGAAYLRQLHQGATFAVSGKMYQAGVGLKYLLVARDRKRLKGVGLRVDARLVLRSRGIAFDDRQYLSPAAGASFFVRF